MDDPYAICNEATDDFEEAQRGAGFKFNSIPQTDKRTRKFEVHQRITSCQQSQNPLHQCTPSQIHRQHVFPANATLRSQQSVWPQRGQGFFPDYFNTAVNQDYVGPIPPQDYYDPQSMSVERKKDLKHGTRLDAKKTMNSTSTMNSWLIANLMCACPKKDAKDSKKNLNKSLTSTLWKNASPSRQPATCFFAKSASNLAPLPPNPSAVGTAKANRIPSPLYNAFIGKNINCIRPAVKVKEIVSLMQETKENSAFKQNKVQFTSTDLTKKLKSSMNSRAASTMGVPPAFQIEITSILNTTT